MPSESENTSPQDTPLNPTKQSSEENHSKLTEGNEKLRGLLSTVLELPATKKLIASATSEPAKAQALDGIYLLLPRAVRWTVKREVFEGYIRRYVFGEKRQ